MARFCLLTFGFLQDGVSLGSSQEDVLGVETRYISASDFNSVVREVVGDDLIDLVLADLLDGHLVQVSSVFLHARFITHQGLTKDMILPSKFQKGLNA